MMVRATRFAAMQGSRGVAALLSATFSIGTGCLGRRSVICAVGSRCIARNSGANKLMDQQSSAGREGWAGDAGSIRAALSASGVALCAKERSLR